LNSRRYEEKVNEYQMRLDKLINIIYKKGLKFHSSGMNSLGGEQSSSINDLSQSSGNTSEYNIENTFDLWKKLNINFFRRMENYITRGTSKKRGFNVFDNSADQSDFIKKKKIQRNKTWKKWKSWREESFNFFTI